MKKPSQLEARFQDGLMLVLGAAIFAFGAYQLFSSGVGSLFSALIIALEISVSVALYIVFRRKWAALFGPTWPRKSN